MGRLVCELVRSFWIACRSIINVISITVMIPSHTSMVCTSYDPGAIACNSVLPEPKLEAYNHTCSWRVGHTQIQLQIQLESE